MRKQFFFPRQTNHPQRRGTPVVTRHAFMPEPLLPVDPQTRLRVTAGLVGATGATVLIGLCWMAPVITSWVGR